jgi:hypothetical protein
VLSPWLLGAWLAGAVLPGWGRAPLAGMALLAATIGAYLLLAGADGGRLAPRLLALAAIAGPLAGAAGGTWRRGGGGRLMGALVAGGVLVAEGLWLQVGERSGAERLAFGVEMVLGGCLAAVLARSGRGAAHR